MARPFVVRIHRCRICPPWLDRAALSTWRQSNGDGSTAHGGSVDGRPTLTHYPYCSLQCGITLRVAPDRVDLARLGLIDTAYIADRTCGGLQAANVLTNPALDPLSRMPEFKVCAVAVSAVEVPVPSRACASDADQSEGTVTPASSDGGMKTLWSSRTV